MMKLKRYGIVLISLFILLGSCFTAAAMSISDGTGDVWHWYYTGTTGSWGGNVANKPNIDITEISSTVNENKITLSLKVVGTIQTSEKVVYWVYFNTTDASYWMSYTNGSGTGFGMKKGEMNYTSNYSSFYTSTENVTILGNTLSVVLDVLGETSQGELWGWAAEYTTYGDVAAEWWGDWAPNSKLPFTPPGTGGNTNDNTSDNNNNGGNTTGKSTPGFEVIPVLAAVAIAAILLKRRR